MQGSVKLSQEAYSIEAVLGRRCICFGTINLILHVFPRSPKPCMLLKLSANSDIEFWVMVFKLHEGLAKEQNMTEKMHFGSHSIKCPRSLGTPAGHSKIAFLSSHA